MGNKVQDRVSSVLEDYDKRWGTEESRKKDSQGGASGDYGFRLRDFGEWLTDPAHNVLSAGYGVLSEVYGLAEKAVPSDNAVWDYANDVLPFIGFPKVDSKFLGEMERIHAERGVYSREGVSALEDIGHWIAGFALAGGAFHKVWRGIRFGGVYGKAAGFDFFGSLGLSKERPDMGEDFKNLPYENYTGMERLAAGAPGEPFFHSFSPSLMQAWDDMPPSFRNVYAAVGFSAEAPLFAYVGKSFVNAAKALPGAFADAFDPLSTRGGATSLWGMTRNFRSPYHFDEPSKKSHESIQKDEMMGFKEEFSGYSGEYIPHTEPPKTRREAIELGGDESWGAHRSLRDMERILFGPLRSFSIDLQDRVIKGEISEERAFNKLLSFYEHTARIAESRFDSRYGKILEDTSVFLSDLPSHARKLHLASKNVDYARSFRGALSNEGHRRKLKDNFLQAMKLRREGDYINDAVDVALSGEIRELIGGGSRRVSLNMIREQFKDKDMLAEFDREYAAALRHIRLSGYSPALGRIPSGSFDDMDFTVPSLAKAAESAKGYMSMNYKFYSKYGGVRAHWGNARIISSGDETTIEAIRNGRRTATTRFGDEAKRYMKYKEGDVILMRRFKDGKSVEEVPVRITKRMHPLKGSGMTPKEWSSKEGWNTKFFLEHVLPKIDDAYQMEFRVLKEVQGQAEKNPASILDMDLRMDHLEDLAKTMEGSIRKMEDSLKTGGYKEYLRQMEVFENNFKDVSYADLRSLYEIRKKFDLNYKEHVEDILALRLRLRHLKEIKKLYGVGETFTGDIEHLMKKEGVRDLDAEIASLEKNLKESLTVSHKKLDGLKKNLESLNLDEDELSRLLFGNVRVGTEPRTHTHLSESIPLDSWHYVRKRALEKVVGGYRKKAKTGKLGASGKREYLDAMAGLQRLDSSEGDRSLLGADLSLAPDADIGALDDEIADSWEDWAGHGNLRTVDADPVKIEVLDALRGDVNAWAARWDNFRKGRYEGDLSEREILWGLAMSRKNLDKRLTGKMSLTKEAEMNRKGLQSLFDMAAALWDDHTFGKLREYKGVEKIISGAQTGADRAGLDYALASGRKIGGWVPKGRRSEDGSVPSKYTGLKETESRNFPERTENNILDSDATVIFFQGKYGPGTKLTIHLAKKHKKPYMLIDLNSPPSLNELKEFTKKERVRVLNVAGSRESKSPGIGQKVQDYLSGKSVDAKNKPAENKPAKNKSAKNKSAEENYNWDYIWGQYNSIVDHFHEKTKNMSFVEMEEDAFRGIEALQNELSRMRSLYSKKPGYGPVVKQVNKVSAELDNKLDSMESFYGRGKYKKSSEGSGAKSSEEKDGKKNNDQASLDDVLYGEKGAGLRSLAAALAGSGALEGTALEGQVGKEKAVLLRKAAAMGKLSAQAQALEAWQAEYLLRLAAISPDSELALSDSLESVSGGDASKLARLTARAGQDFEKVMDEMDEWIYLYGVPPMVAASELALKGADSEMFAARSLYG